MINKECKLGKLEKIDPRKYWQNEAQDFTPWLAEEENIILLGEAIGMDLEVVAKEEKVGCFCADILCKDIMNDHFVIIENQLEKTDHSHLGQIITYCSGLEASACIWIAKQFTEEHRAAIDWLNNITDDNHYFFGIEIELYKIGDSPLAPKFNVVAKPNDWAKTVRTQANNAPLTETKQLQLEYWTAFKEYIDRQKKSPFKPRKPQPAHWYDFAMGISDAYISATVNSRESIISIWLNIVGSDAKEHYDSLHSLAYEKSFAEVSPELSWLRLDNRKQCTILLNHKADFTKRDEWTEQFDWLYQTMISFNKFFQPLVKKWK